MQLKGYGKILPAHKGRFLDPVFGKFTGNVYYAFSESLKYTSQSIEGNVDINTLITIMHGQRRTWPPQRKYSLVQNNFVHVFLINQPEKIFYH